MAGHQAKRIPNPHARFADRLHDGSLDSLTRGKAAQRFHFKDQFEARDKGDIA